LAYLRGRDREREREIDMQQTLQQIIDERISFLKEQINPQNKSEENRTFQLQIDAIRSASAAD
jgi:phosphoserine aminotransferase